MTRFSTATVLFYILLFILILFYQQGYIAFFYVWIPIFFYLLSLVLGSAFIRLNFYFHSLNQVNTKEKEIAITFDDGPNSLITRKLLALLKENNTPATFFLVGKNISSNEQLVKAMHADGHIIGNHGYSHNRWFDLFSSSKMYDEISQTNQLIRQLTGNEPLLFRPPFGVTNPNLAKALKRADMESVGWSLRTLDTVRNKENVLKVLKNKTKPGSVVLFHDSDEKIPGIVEEYLQWLNNNQFKVVSFDKLFSINVYEQAN